MKCVWYLVLQVRIVALWRGNSLTFTSGSGCSTFLKVIANERGEYARVSGDVRYAGIDAHEMAKHYKGEVVYNEEGAFLLVSIWL